MQQEILVTRKTIDRGVRWLVSIVLLLAGGVTGTLVGYEKAGEAYDVMSQEQKTAFQKHYDSHPSNDASCVGKPESCAYGIEVLQGLECATWAEDNGRLIKMFCTPLFHPRPKSEPEVMEPAIET